MTIKSELGNKISRKITMANNGYNSMRNSTSLKFITFNQLNPLAEQSYHAKEWQVGF